MGTVLSGLYVYPVKSCRGIALETAELDARGIRFDRNWMIVDAQDRFLTQRTHPQLALVAVEIGASHLHLSAPEGAIDVSLDEHSGEKRIVEVWGDFCEAIDEGEAASRWCSAVLGQPCRLVRIARDWIRPVDGRYAPAGYQTAFTDGYPLLCISEASLAELNSRLDSPLPMNRFRPNLVVTGTDPYAEDRWQVVRIGGITCLGVKLSARCKIATTDQTSGQVIGTEPLKTLATYRQIDRGIVFGQNMVHTEVGSLAVGDRVEVIQAGDPV